MLRFPDSLGLTDINGLIDISAARSVPNQWVDISEVAGAPILVGIIVGPDARRLEQLSDGFWRAYASLPPSWARRADRARYALGTPEGQRIALVALAGIVLVLLA